MAHASLLTTSVSCAGLGTSRRVGVTSTDPQTLIGIFAADAASVAASSGAPLSESPSPALVPKVFTVGAGESRQIENGAGFVGYYLIRGAAPTAVWIDGAATSAQPAGSSSQGTVKTSVTPAAAASPIVVGTNDPRVTTIEAPVRFSSVDGSLAESPIPAPGIASTVTGVTLDFGADITKSDTNYLTIVVSKRDGAGGAAVPIATCTTKVTGGVAFLAFQDVSMGALAGGAAPGLRSTDGLTIKSAATGTGQAVVGGMVRITYAPAS
jgi:hypothetical protein